MPPGSPIGSDFPFHSFLPIKETVPVRPPYDKTPARHPDDFTDGLPFVVDKTQGGDRKDPVEGPVPKRKTSEVSPDPWEGGGTARAGKTEPVEVFVETCDAKALQEESSREPSGPATRIEDRLSGKRAEMTGDQTVFRFSDPSAARGFVPGVVGGGIHQETRRFQAAIRSFEARSISGRVVNRPRESLTAPHALSGSRPMVRSPGLISWRPP